MLGACIATGCGQRAELTLHQPTAPPLQRQLALASNWSYFSLGAERRSCLLYFPLPGSEAGPRAFILYLSTADALGELPVEPAEEGSGRGFLIQTVGALKGKTHFRAGTVRCRNVWLAPRMRRIELDLECDDGTRITGGALLDQNAQELQTFERRYALDIAGLGTTASQPVGAAEPTTARTTRATNSD